jgi:hypothetical protein
MAKKSVKKAASAAGNKGARVKSKKKAELEAPNVWFRWEHQEHGDLEVSAFVPEDARDPERVQIVNVCMPDDVPVEPEEAGITDDQMETLRDLAFDNRHTEGDVELPDEPGEPSEDDEIPW